MSALHQDDTRAFADSHPNQGRDDVHAEVDEPTASLAWRILTSPRTFGVLAASLAAWLALASIIPQRPLMADLAAHMSFSAAEAAHDVGLDDVLVSWPLQLIALLMVLNLVGLWLASRLGRALRPKLRVRASSQVAAPPSEVQARLLTAIGGRIAVTRSGDTTIATRGFLREGLVVAAVGVLTLFAALAVSRGSALDGRLTLIPGAATLPESSIRDGDLMLLRQLPLGLFCGRPDPQDPSRTFPCRAATSGSVASTPVEVGLTPGRTSHVGAFALRPLTESLRVPRDTDPVALVVRRGPEMERLSVELGKTVELKRGGERITPLSGPDGPLVVLQQVVDGKPTATLLTPQLDLSNALATAPSALQIEVEHPTSVSVAVTTSPEWPLVLAGLGLVVLGLLLAALLPHIRVQLSPHATGTAIEVESVNRPSLVANLMASLEGAEKPRPIAYSSPLAALRKDLPATALALLLTAAGLALGLGASFTSAALPLGLGAFLALGTRAAPVLGALTLIAGLGTAPSPVIPTILELSTSVVLGVGLGLAGRWLAAHASITHGPLVLAGLLALLVGLLHLVPSPSLMLAQAGDPLVTQAIMGDGPSSMRVLWPISAFSAGTPNPLAPLLWFGLALAVACFAFHQRSTDARTRHLEHVILAFGALVAIAGILGLAGLFASGSIDAEVFRHDLDLAAERATALAAPTVTHELALWSRPFVDGLTLVSGLALVLLALSSKRRLPAPEQPAQTSTLPLMATNALVIAAFLFALTHGPDGDALLALAGGVAGLGALVSSFDAKARLMSPLLVMAAAVFGVAACLLPPLIAA